MRLGSSTATLTATFAPNDKNNSNDNSELGSYSFSLTGHDESLQPQTHHFELNYDLTFVVSEPAQQEPATAFFALPELTSLLAIGIGLLAIGLTRKMKL